MENCVGWSRRRVGGVIATGLKVRSTWKRAQDERAQGVVEFALIAVILMFLFLGTVDFSRFLYYNMAIQNATRVGVEAASNHCPSFHNCYLSTATPDDYILQSTYCEADPYVNLKMVNPVNTCNPCGPTVTSCTDPCGSAGCQSCPTQGQDMCVLRDTTSTDCSTTHPCVTVYAGYKFQPISPFLNWVFQARSCWPVSNVPGSGSTDSTSNGHTLCASSTGRVS